MYEATKEQLKEWKSTYGQIYQLTANDGKSCIIFDPTSKLPIMKMVADSAANGQSMVTDAIMNNCWLGGDEELKGEEYRNDLDDQINEIFDLPEFEIKHYSQYAEIETCGVTIKVKYPARSDIKEAEKRNKHNKAFGTNIYLLENLILDEDQLNEIKNNNRTYMGLLLAIKEVKKSKRVKVKKL